MQELEIMNKKTEFFKSFTFNELYTQEQIGKRFGKNRHYVSAILKNWKIQADDKRGLTKFYYGDVIMRLTDEGAFDKYLVEPTPKTPPPLTPYQPKNFTLI